MLVIPLSLHRVTMLVRAVLAVLVTLNRLSNLFWKASGSNRLGIVLLYLGLGSATSTFSSTQGSSFLWGLKHFLQIAISLTPFIGLPPL